jgi:myo-inositol-1(or 4)-monophosphatase
MSIVTQADREIEQYLGSLFDRPHEGSFLIGEETIHKKPESYIHDAFEHIAWIVDPIDGTAAYAHHIPTWGISIGMMVNGVLKHGAIYLPVTGELFISSSNGKVLYGKDIFPFSEYERFQFEPISGKPAKPDESGMIAVTQSVAKGNGIKVINPVQALACAVLPLAYLLLDRYMAYVGTLKLWDIAGALPLLSASGFHIQLKNGTPVTCAVNDDLYYIGADNAERWKIRDLLICGRTKEATDYLIKGLKAAE